MEFDLKKHWLSLLLTASAVLAAGLVYALTQKLVGEDIIFVAFSVLAAFALLKSHKTSWLVALIALVVASTNQAFRLIDYEDIPSSFLLGLHLGTLVLLIFALVQVFYRSRYPYLDRRQGWLKAPAPRFDLQVPVLLKTEEELSGLTESISLSGCRIKISGPLPRSFQRRFIEVKFKDLPQVSIRAQHVGFEASVLRLKFKEFINGNSKMYAEWLAQFPESQDHKA